MMLSRAGDQMRRRAHMAAARPTPRPRPASAALPPPPSTHAEGGRAQGCVQGGRRTSSPTLRPQRQPESRRSSGGGGGGAAASPSGAVGAPPPPWRDGGAVAEGPPRCRAVAPPRTWTTALSDDAEEGDGGRGQGAGGRRGEQGVGGRVLHQRMAEGPRRGFGGGGGPAAVHAAAQPRFPYQLSDKSKLSMDWNHRLVNVD